MQSPKEVIHLQVGDASQSAAFYEALLEAPPTHRGATLAVFDLDSPPLVLTLEERPRAQRSKAAHEGSPRPHPSARSGSTRSLPARWALLVAEPKHVGDAAIRLRRAGVRLWVQDQGIEAHDPDGNAWRVRCVPATPGRAVVTTREHREGSRR